MTHALLFVLWVTITVAFALSVRGCEHPGVTSGDGGMPQEWEVAF